MAVLLLVALLLGALTRWEHIGATGECAVGTNPFAIFQLEPLPDAVSDDPHVKSSFEELMLRAELMKEEKKTKGAVRVSLLEFVNAGIMNYEAEVAAAWGQRIETFEECDAYLTARGVLFDSKKKEKEIRWFWLYYTDALERKKKNTE